MPRPSNGLYSVRRVLASAPGAMDFDQPGLTTPQTLRPGCEPSRDAAAASEIVTAPSGDAFFAEFMSGPVPDGSAPAPVLQAICASPHLRRSQRPLWGN